MPKILAMPLATAVLDRLSSVYPAARDTVKVASMRAYMRDQFSYLGLPATMQVKLAREVVSDSARKAVRLIA